jgi:hypothetical protein
VYGHDIGPLQQFVKLDQLDAQGRRNAFVWPPAPGHDSHPKGGGDFRDMTPNMPKAHDTDRLAVELATHRGRPFARFHCVVCGRNLTHERNRKPNGQLSCAGTETAACLSHDNAALIGRCEVDVVGMISRLRDDPQVGQLVKQITRKPSALAIGYQRIEAAQCLGTTKWGGKNPHLSPLPQTIDTRSVFIRFMDIIQDCNSHSSPYSLSLTFGDF